MKPQSANEFSAFLGIDWTDAKPDICLQPANCELYNPLPAQQRTDRSLIPTGIGLPGPSRAAVTPRSRAAA